MPKAKKKAAGRPPQKVSAYSSTSSLAPQILEQAAQGWLQSTGIPSPTTRPTRTAADHRLAEALTETLQQLRAELAELRSRLDRLENR
jgi:ubiquinone biosynthesis protein UbiJ